MIEGLAEFRAGEADTISGITAATTRPIVFKLTQPTGDFLYRIAMPAAGPIPREVASCFTEAGEYGRYVVSSGPYMIEGSDAHDATSCDTLKPISGFDPDTSLTLVRNPDYDPATDTTEARENHPDGFEFRINTNVDDIFNKIAAGEIEDAIASEPPEVLREYSQDEELQPFLHVNAGDRTWYITMNLTQPPFDDIHVRKATNFVMDKEGLRRAWGGPLFGEIANHIVPDVMLNDTLADYVPYPSEGDAGDVEAAMEEMKLSKYDTDQDGICDAPECKDVLYLTATDRLRQDMVPPTVASLEKIGITLNVRSVEDAYTPIQTVNENIPISGRAGWGKDYADTLDVHGALRRAQHHPDGQRRTTRSSAQPASSSARSRDGRASARVSRAWMPTSTRATRCSIRASASPAGAISTRSSWKRSCRGCRTWTPRRSRSRARGHAVGVRPVRRYDRVRPRGAWTRQRSKEATRSESCPGRRGSSPAHNVNRRRRSER